MEVILLSDEETEAQEKEICSKSLQFRIRFLDPLIRGSWFHLRCLL